MSVQASHLSFAYGEGAHSVLDDLSVTLNRKDISLIIGNTGEGKSTFLYLAAGLYPHYAGIQKSGTVTVENEDLGEMDPSERCRIAGMMFQNPDLQFCMDTVFNEMVFCLENIREDPSCFPPRIEEALQFCGIPHLRNRKLSTLSGGEKQKVVLACLLLLKPKWIFLDEPFASIDSASRRFLVEKLKKIHREYGIGIVAVDHHPENWADAADAVEYLLAGKIVVRVRVVAVIPGQRQPVAGVIAGHVPVGAEVHDADIVVGGSGKEAGYAGEQLRLVGRIAHDLRAVGQAADG